MSPLSLFHSVAWWSLVVLVTASAVNVSPPQAGNDDAPMEPHSVKDMLHFLGKMKADENLGKKFVEVLVKDVEKYLDTNMVAKKKYEDNLADFLQHVEKLRNGLLNNPNDFGKYKDLTESVMLKDLEVLVQWIPILHTEFWFFYFLTSIEADTLVWKDLVDARYSQVPTGSRAIQWLTDKVKPVEDKYAVQRGFTDADIKERDMSIGIVAGNLGINYYGGGPLNYMQYGLFFFSGDALHPSNLASAMLFLAEFCREVNEDKFPEKTTHDKYKCLKDVCKDLAKKIDDLHKLLMPLYYPLEMPNPSGGNDEFRVALATLHKGDVLSMNCTKES
ncbi:hypothetical protein BgAZ_207370 [Babesia gibsoni]|uniref:Uncharacterized protein n=1 Tax=Babesia gibsoni TaxID=33632 RepID=A0AAD8US02_BABGI|nr:hypothetical protein BgAZ_207370 [Babesia gibsoni]